MVQNIYSQLTKHFSTSLFEALVWYDNTCNKFQIPRLFSISKTQWSVNGVNIFHVLTTKRIKITYSRRQNKEKRLNLLLWKPFVWQPLFQFHYTLACYEYRGHKKSWKPAKKEVVQWEIGTNKVNWKKICSKFLKKSC